MAQLLQTLHPEVNDTLLLSLILVNLACSLELVITRTVKWNFLLIFLWLPVLGLFQLPYVNIAFDHILTVLRIIGTTRVCSAVRSD